MAGPIIEHYSAERIPNPNRAGDVSWQLYHTVRNAVFRCCRQFGPSGPMGECPINNAVNEPIDDWPLGDPQPIDFFVVDDQWNHERYVYVEIVNPAAFAAEWLLKLVDTMSQFPGWGVGINGFGHAYILVFADRLMVTGTIFFKCTDFASVVHAGQRFFSAQSS